MAASLARSRAGTAFLPGQLRRHQAQLFARRLSPRHGAAQRADDGSLRSRMGPRRSGRRDALDQRPQPALRLSQCHRRPCVVSYTQRRGGFGAAGCLSAGTRHPLASPSLRAPPRHVAPSPRHNAGRGLAARLRPASGTRSELGSPRASLASRRGGRSGAPLSQHPDHPEITRVSLGPLGGRPRILARPDGDDRSATKCPPEGVGVRPQGPALRSYNSNRRIVRDAVSIFGIERCIFASNFPVAGLRVDFDTLVRSVSQMLADHTDLEREGFFWRNAAAFYRLPEPGTRISQTNRAGSTAERGRHATKFLHARFNYALIRSCRPAGATGGADRSIKIILGKRVRAR